VLPGIIFGAAMVAAGFSLIELPIVHSDYPAFGWLENRMVLAIGGLSLSMFFARFLCLIYNMKKV
jgi:hypothetical protein